MTDTINIKKGLDIPVTGTAALRLTDARNIGTYAVKPTDYVGLVPRLLVAEGDEVSAGGALFCDKRDERIRFTSPVDGRVKAIVRGDKRLLLAVVVERAGTAVPAHSKSSVSATALEEDGLSFKERMLHNGLWTCLRQRPFGCVANPDDRPKAIFISCFDSAPLAPDYDFLLAGREEDFNRGIEALIGLEAPIHICFRPGQQLAAHVGRSSSKQVQVHYVSGPHPAGNVGTQIAAISPINKGEVVWTINPQDVAVLGSYCRTGVYCPERLIAVAGPEIKYPQYYRIVAGASLATIVQSQTLNPAYPEISEPLPLQGSRLISGNILSGTQIASDGFVGAYDSLVSILPEGNYYDFMGWLMPGLKKYSFSRTFWSGFVPRWLHSLFDIMPPCLKQRFDTNTHGEVRPLVFTGNFERVFPFDIYPTQLIKACIIGDVELQENLGIYEVEPEDFALCEFIDTSKTDIQPIIREALEKLRKEALDV